MSKRVQFRELPLNYYHGETSRGILGENLTYLGVKWGPTNEEHDHNGDCARRTRKGAR